MRMHFLISTIPVSYTHLASIDAVNSGKVIVNKSKKIDERLSAGIICTYGDQASLIRCV